MAHPLFDVYFFSPSDDGDASSYGGSHRSARRSVTAAPALDESALIQRLRAGDVAALDTCMHQYGDRIVRVARVVTGSHDLAWDVAQDVFIELWRSRERLDPDRNLGGYLYRAARHRALDVIRHERSQARVARAVVPSPDDVSMANLGDVAVDSDEFRARVHAVLNALPPRCREIFLLHREAGLDYAEIEAALGVSNATIRNQVSRATRHLARALAAGLFDDWLG